MRATGVKKVLAACGLAACLATGAGAGSPERTLLIIDPSDADALYTGNHYKFMRGIPESHVLYMEPGAADIQTFVSDNLDALFGEMARRGLSDQIDFIVIAATDEFYMDAPGLVNDGCSPVRRFSITGAYTLAFNSAEFLAGGVPVSRENGYKTNTTLDARRFSSATGWRDGLPRTDGDRYFIGAQLGYTGERGNTADEVIDMIDRSALADGTRPAGTFYFMETADNIRSDPRDGLFTTVVNALASLGGTGEHLFQNLPQQRHDVLGVMTGLAGPNIDGANMTILPGAFCDHLTSWAATFDISAQTKVSRWIVKGASGSWGQVEEPCNYEGKFPSARMHVHYFQGLSLGESVFRAIGFWPFQGMLYGDPLTRPHAHIPTVSFTGLPTGPSSTGFFILSYQGSTTNPGKTVSQYELFVDGVLKQTVNAGFPMLVDASVLSDGWHEVRVVGLESTNVRVPGVSVQTFERDASGRSVTIEPLDPVGDLSTNFRFVVRARGTGIIETRVVQGGRVVASVGACAGELSAHGSSLGAGEVTVQGEALLADGSLVRSAPVTILVDPMNADAGSEPPRAVRFTKRVATDDAFVLELPASSDDDPGTLSFEILQGPTQATIGGGGESGTSAFRIVRPDPGASGSDLIVYRVTDAGGAQQVGQIRLMYDGYDLDVDGSGVVDIDDLYAHHQTATDLNGDGVVDQDDRNLLMQAIRCDEALERFDR
ncbi:MAG: hypothetical protein ACF8SC_09315 [Phycisphaerales bacterium JB037]